MENRGASSGASTEKNKALERRLVLEGFSKGNLAVVEELVAVDAVDHSATPGMPPGLDGVKLFVTTFRTAFPDFNYTIEDQIAEGDKVVTRVTWNGTHKGPFMGIPPTGKIISVTGIDITRWSNGKAVEHWSNEDIMGMMQQLGVIPTQSQTG